MDSKLTFTVAPEQGMQPTTLPMPPNERELAILRRVLGIVDVEGRDQLAAQLRMLQVSPASDTTCRIYVLHPDAPRAAFARHGREKLPVRVPVRSRQGRVIGDIAVVVEDGHLRALQYVRYDALPSLMLPDVDMLELPERELPTVIRTYAARQSLEGLRTLEEPVVRDFTLPSPRSTRWRWLVALACIAATLALAAVAYEAGRSTAADIDAARAAGTSAGEFDGASQARTAGTFAGTTEGELAGRASTFGPAFASTRARVLAAERRAALARAREVAATTQFPNPSSCVGFWDDTTWVCAP